MTSTTIQTDINVYFIEVKNIGSVSRQPTSMQSAFTSMKSYKFSPNWIKEDEVLDKEWTDSDNVLFILESFDGKVFDYLWAKKLRIISPLTVLYCYSKECSVPFKSIPVKPFPVFSQCMRKLFVSISGFDGHKKQEMITKITRMCGNFCKDLTKNVTHLVTDSVRTKKYKVAKERGVAVVSQLWIDHCWTEGQHYLMNGGHKDIVDKYQLKIFSKLLITVSQIEVEERKEIERLVVVNGGQYSPSLKLSDPNSILLLRTPDGDKFKYAHMRGVPCLNIQWLYDSRDKGYALPEDEYIIGSKSQRLPKLSENQSKPSIDTEMHSISLTNSSETPTTSVEKRTEEVDNQSDEKITKLIADKSDELFLEGCDVFVVGFKQQVFETMKSALLSSGAMVFNEYKNLVTHVIVGPECADTQLKQFFDNKSCKVVSIEWLLECVKTNECCDCRPFEVKNPKCDANRSSNGSQKRKRKADHIFEGQLTVVLKKRAHKALEKWREDSKIDSKHNHKSLGDRLNDTNDIVWQEEEGKEGDVPSQKLYREADHPND